MGDPSFEAIKDPKTDCVKRYVSGFAIKKNTNAEYNEYLTFNMNGTASFFLFIYYVFYYYFVFYFLIKFYVVQKLKYRIIKVGIIV